MKADSIKITAGRAVALAIGLLMAAVPATAQGPSLAMLDRLEPGLWEIRIRPGNDETERLCIRDGRTLIQLRHPGVACDQTIAEDSAATARVHYSCRGRGYGHTTIRFESRQLVQLQSQGIAGGMPFSFRAEGRRVSSCQPD